jgi:hypothetical protein
VFRRHGHDGPRPAGLDYEPAETGSTFDPEDEDHSPGRALLPRSGDRGFPSHLSHRAPVSLTACQPQGSRSGAGKQIPRLSGARGDSFSAIDFPQPAARSHPSWFAALGSGDRAEGIAPAFSRLSTDPSSCRVFASPSNLAVGSGWLRPPDGKVRWQKRFAFPARRMRRGLRY